MASLQEYCEKLPMDTLEDIIFGDLDAYPKEVILAICNTLLERQPDRLDILKIIWQLTDEP